MSRPKRTRCIPVTKNIDPDYLDFCEPKPKKGKAAPSGCRFGAPLSEAQVAEYGQGPVVPNTVKTTQ